MVEPSQVARYLGLFFDPLLTFKEHISRRISQARPASHQLGRLANIERGLSPEAIRQLYLACVTLVADYGSSVVWKNQAFIKRQARILQNLALRKIQGVFKTAPIAARELEAALPPSHVRLDSRRKYAFRETPHPRAHTWIRGQ